MKYSLKAILLICVTGAYAPSVGSGPGPGSPRLLSLLSSTRLTAAPKTLADLEDVVPVHILQYFEPKDLSKMRNTNRTYAAQGKEHILPRAQNAPTVDELLAWAPLAKFNMSTVVDKLKSFTDAPSDTQLDAVVALSMPEHSTPEELQALKSLVKFLLTAGADVNAQDRYGRTRLHRAVWQNNILDVQALLKYDKTDVNAKDKGGETPLHRAACNGRTETVQVLLKREQIDVNAKDPIGWTPLHFAVYNGHEEVVQALLKHEQIDVNAKGKNGWTPLHFAADNGHTEIVQALLEHEQIDVNATDTIGQTPLHRAANNGRTAVVRALLANKADAKLANNAWDTPEMIARMCDHTAVVELLEAHIRSQSAAN
jgi:ankyrin repeat protein